MKTFSKDFEDLLQLFNQHQVEFVVVGGWAMAAYGHQRMTKDLDVLVRATPDNAVRTTQALHQFGAPKSLCNVRDFEKPGMVTQLGVPPWRIDVITEISGVTFDEAIVDATRFKFLGVTASVISRSALIKNNLVSARIQDLADAQV